MIYPCVTCDKDTGSDALNWCSHECMKKTYKDLDSELMMYNVTRAHVKLDMSLEPLALFPRQGLA